MRAPSATQNIVRWTGVGAGLLVIPLLVALLPIFSPTAPPTQAAQHASSLPPPVATQEIQSPVLITPGIPAPATATGSTEIVSQEDFGNWRYIAGRGDENALYGVVRYDDTSVDALTAYAEANRQLIPELAAVGGQIPVAITFRDYVTPGQFRQWCMNMSLHIKETTLRAIEINGVRDTIVIRATANDPLPEDQLRPLLDQPPHPRIFKGIISTTATADAKELPTLAENSAVFLVDVTPVIVRRQLAARNIVGATQADIQIDSPFWAMEDLGLQYFRPLR